MMEVKDHVAVHQRGVIEAGSVINNKADLSHVAQVLGEAAVVYRVILTKSPLSPRPASLLLLVIDKHF